MLDQSAQLTNPRRRRGTLALNVDFFSEIDTEAKAYFLGFLTADGYVCRSGKTVACCVAETDADILGQMRSALGSEAPIKTKISTGYTGSQPQRVLTLSSRSLVSDLMKLGVVPNKSHCGTYAEVPNDLERHYIRGLVDGDGCLTRHGLWILGTENVLKGINNAAARHVGRPLLWSPLKSGHPRLWAGRKSRDIVRWIYSGATYFLYRKYQIFVEYWL